MNIHALPARHIEPAGQETGWWDDSGRPAPWPQDFADPDAGWTTGNTDVTADYGDETDPENPPFCPLLKWPETVPHWQVN